MRSLHSHQNGFTFIEILVVTAIMLILTGVGIVNYISFNERQKIITTAREVQLFIRQAQSYAQTKPVKDVTCGTGTVQGFRVVATNSSSMSIVALCGSDTTSLTQADELSQISLTTGVTFDTETLPLPQIDFYSLGKGGDANTSSIILIGSNQTYGFLVSPEGGVTEGNFTGGARD